MSKRGRAAMGVELVQNTSGSELAKVRSKILLRTLSGDLTIDEACEQLSLKRSQVFQLRSEMLQGVVDSLEPKRAGRPRKCSEIGNSTSSTSGEEAETKKLENYNEEELEALRWLVQYLQAREEVGIILAGKRK